MAVAPSVVALLLGLSFGPTPTSASQAKPGGQGAAQNPQVRPDGQRGDRSRPQWGEWWKNDAIRKELTLSDLQVRKIDNIYQARLRQEQPYVEELKKEGEAWERLTRERTATPAAYSIQVGRVLSLRQKIDETRFVMLYRMYLELTPDQHAKLQAIFDRNRNGRGNEPSK